MCDVIISGELVIFASSDVAMSSVGDVAVALEVVGEVGRA